jgi:amidase
VPANPTVAFPHVSPQFARILDVDGARVPYFDQTVWAGIATLNGLPATTAPIGRAANGLPIGAPVIGGFLDGTTTIASAS